MNKKALINYHAKEYIQTVFANRLREEGFQCPDDNMLCWYRIRNGNLMDSIIFHSSWPNFPLSLGIDYEIAPLFFTPFHISCAHYNPDSLFRWDSLRFQAIFEIVDGIKYYASTPFSEDICVYAPTCSSRGLYVLTEIVLPYMSTIQTLEDCYRAHKLNHPADRTSNATPRFSNMSRSFLEEALFWNDEEVLSSGEQRIARALNFYQNQLLKKPKSQTFRTELANWQQLYIAFSEDAREHYLNILRQREEANKILLQLQTPPS